MQFSEMIQQLIPRLQVALEKEAKATRLDDAIFIRNLIQGLKDGKNPVEQKGRLTTAEASAQDSARSVIKQSLKKLSEIETQLEQDRSSLNLSFSRIMAPEVGQTLLERDLRQSEQALRQCYFLKGETESIVVLHRPEETTPKNDSAGNRTTRFSEETRKLLNAGIDQEQELRNNLIAKTEELLLNSEVTDVQKTELSSILDFVQADHSKGLMAMRLMRVPQDLPESGFALLADYRSELKSIVNKLQIAQQNAWQELQVQLKPVVREQVARRRLHSGLLDSGQTSPPADDSIRTAGQGGSASLLKPSMGCASDLSPGRQLLSDQLRKRFNRVVAPQSNQI